MGIALAGVRPHSIFFLASTVHASGLKQAVCPVNKWLLRLASECPALVWFWLKESFTPVRVCGATLNKAYKDLVPAPLVYCKDVKLDT